MLNPSAKPSAGPIAGFVVAVSLLAFFATLAVMMAGERSAELIRRALKSWRTHGAAEPAAVDPVLKLKESRVDEQRLLFGYEKQQASVRAEVIQRRRLYQDGAGTRAAVAQAEQSLVALLARIHETRRSLAEIDLALAEAALGDELLQQPAIDGFRETDAFAHFTGGPWSLKQAPRIEKFFSQTYGRPLPISAFGQTATHARMRLDHRDALDVALSPDSAEGRALIKHLRASGIPFIAFKNAVPGAATGPHIHIGKPSLRTAAR